MRLEFPTAKSDGARALVDLASAVLPIDSPQLGWSEQKFADWWQATNEAVVLLHAKHPNTVTSVVVSRGRFSRENC